jgi:two-component sensor histidine kinase/CheY-like chemotaxis protein
MASEPIRVLLVEDDEDDFVLTRDLLASISGARYQLDWGVDWDTALAEISRAGHDVYLLDYRLGPRDGLELLREAIARGSRRPLILLTGQGDRDVNVEAMRAGAADFIVKGHMDAATLERSIRYALERHQHEEALRRMHEDLERRVQERTAALACANEALQAEVRERQRVEEQLRASLREKEILLREIHHRVKNNLQVITTLFKLQATSVEDPRARELLREGQNRVKAMALVHENLYRAKDLGRIDFAQYVHHLVEQLLRSHGAEARLLSLNILVEDVFLGVDTAIPCGMIVNELVCNSLRHAFPENRPGEVRIELRALAPQRYTLRVSDNGVGLPAGLDLRNPPSLGLQIVTALTRQLDGTLEHFPSAGAVFQITFSELHYKERGYPHGSQTDSGGRG